LSSLDVVRRIPAGLQGKAADGLIDLILDSSNAPKLSSSLGRSILHHWQSDQLATESGLMVLLEASMQLEPQKTAGIFDGLGLSSVAESLRARVQT